MTTGETQLLEEPTRCANAGRHPWPLTCLAASLAGRVWRVRPSGGSMDARCLRWYSPDGLRFRPRGRAGSEDAVRVEVSPEAEEFVRGEGGQVWVWAAHPRMCCLGAPAYMYAATKPPPDPSAFSPLYAAGLEIWYRIPGGRRPDVLEIGLRGKRRPRVEAYWDGCIYAL